jgi:septal ring factor EnvC (AmiA/AmiB activator)
MSGGLSTECIRALRILPQISHPSDLSLSCRAPNDSQPVVAPKAATATNSTLDLLKKARTQLTERKQSIEADLARMTDLTKELETVNTQIEALDKTLGVF